MANELPVVAGTHLAMPGEVLVAADTLVVERLVRREVEGELHVAADTLVVERSIRRDVECAPLYAADAIVGSEGELHVAADTLVVERSIRRDVERAPLFVADVIVGSEGELHVAADTLVVERSIRRDVECAPLYAADAIVGSEGELHVAADTLVVERSVRRDVERAPLFVADALVGSEFELHVAADTLVVERSVRRDVERASLFVPDVCRDPRPLPATAHLASTLPSEGRLSMKWKGIATCLLGAALAVACSSSSSGGGGFASQFCSKVSSCGSSVPLCQGEFSALVLSSSCQQMLENLSCAEIAAPTPPSWWSSCFPPCTTTASACNSDGTVTECSNGTTYTIECAGVCSALSLTYTGTCAMSYGAQTATTPKCWCK